MPKRQATQSPLLTEILPTYFAERWKPINERTKAHYSRSIKFFAAAIGREPRMGDLTEENLLAFVRLTLADGNLGTTANQRVKQLTALWNWAARKRLLDAWPPRGTLVANTKLEVPPYASDELHKLFAACCSARGWIGPHAASVWWCALHWLVMDTLRSLVPILEIRREWFDLKNAELHFPTEAPLKAAVLLSEPTRMLLGEMFLSPTPTGLLFDRQWQDNQSAYSYYRNIIQAAGLPWRRRQTGFEKVRLTAIALKANGGLPTTLPLPLLFGAKPRKPAATA